jgi:membrane peptidoglycan carboxypeptidase
VARPPADEGSGDRRSAGEHSGREGAPIIERPPSGERSPRRRSSPPRPAVAPGAGQVQPDRPTTVIPPVNIDPEPLRDPIEVVKAAMEGPRPPTTAGRGGRPPRGGNGRPPPGGDYPRPPPGWGGHRPQLTPPRLHVNWKWVWRGLAAAVAVLIVLPIVTFAMAYLMVDVPKPGDIRTNQVSTILASDGSELGKIVPPEGNRVDVDINQVPQHVRNAVMAAEDRNFYSNPGFSFAGFARAVENNIFGGDTQGGSTITQQYVKNALVGSQRAGIGGLTRKAKELVISTKMSREWSKDQVLQAYLNIIYFGRGAYGVAAASKAYFNKPVEQLTVSEGALLAALIRRPSSLDPAVDPQGAVKRWNWVLDGMVTIGALSPSERAAQVFPPTVPPQPAQAPQTNGPDGLIQRQVTQELMELFNVTEQTLNTEGLQVTTTIDPRAQQAAEQAVSKYLNGQDSDMRAAVVSIDPRTGSVRAYYGGADANGFDFAQAGLQTGSAFKVFALIAALQQNIGLGYQVDSSPLTVNGITITNVEGESCGTCSIAEALKRSLNTSYYRLMLKLKNGPVDVADAAHKAGIADSFAGVERTLSEDGKGGPPNNGIVLGQYQTRPIDMASAYATLAASGTYHKPHFVQKVVNAEGQVLFDAGTSNNAGEKRIDDAVANNVISAMEPIAAYSNGHSLAGGRPSAAKTGTTQLGDTGADKDAWMVGFTPSLSTAVWVGTTQGNKPLQNKWGSPVYGSGIPSDIWKSTMDNALEGTKDESFPKPTEIGGYAGVPSAPPPSRTLPPSTTAPPSDQQVIQPSVEVAPGITIPIGPPTTVPVGPPTGDTQGTVPSQGSAPGPTQGVGPSPPPGSSQGFGPGPPPP